MSEPALKIAAADGVLRITLNRPDKLNSLTKAVGRDLLKALEDASADDACRVIVLTGAGRAFCAGQDLADGVYVKGGAQPDLGDTVDAYNPVILRLRSLPKPVVAAVNGIAAGAGASLALASDIVIAARSASFLQAFAKIGIIPDCGSTYFLPRLVGEARAKGLSLLAEPLSAEMALAWGLIWKVVDDDKLAAEVDQLAQRLAKAPTYGLGLAKAALHASPDNSLAEQLALERRLQSEAGRSPDYAEGVGAFLEKRKPSFSGRKA
jgi:2-(1,2-epoxy-1,2-dihydrophenyl)acetyl-CoA isomerase